MANLAVDIDDTLADTQSVMLAWVNHHLDEPIAYADLTREHREEATGRYHELVQEFLSRLEEHRIKPFGEALDGIRRLHAAGHAIHIVSSRREALHRATLDWLTEHGFSEYLEEVHPRPSAVQGTEFKRTVVERIRPAAAFDDTQNVAIVLASVCPTVYLIDKPWNAGTLPPNVRRAPDFDTAATWFIEGRLNG